jgi:hypothetical protein
VGISVYDELPPFVVRYGEDEEVPFGLRDLEPTVRSIAKIKIATAVEAVIARALARLAALADESLRDQGYRH